MAEGLDSNDGSVFAYEIDVTATNLPKCMEGSDEEMRTSISDFLIFIDDSLQSEESILFYLDTEETSTEYCLDRAYDLGPYSTSVRP